MAPKFNSRTFIPIAAAVIGAVALAFGPNILAEDAAKFLQSIFGDGYKKWLWGLLILCYVVAAAFSFLKKDDRPMLDGQPVAMPYSMENLRLVGDARWFWEENEAARSFEQLKKIGDADIQARVSGLQTRWRILQDEKHRGTISADDFFRETNKVSAAVLALISALEKVEPPRSFSPFSKKEAGPAELSPALWEEIRADLFARYQLRYDQKIEDRIALTMDLSYSREGFSDEFVERFFVDEAKTGAEVRGKLLEAFEKHRRLAIIGDPGAGKTTVMLDLALGLMAQRAGQPDEPVPFIFNLAAWDEKEPLFRDWLVRVLKDGFGISAPLAERLLLERRVLPFLDGLDELGRSQPPDEQDRLIKACSASIRQFLPGYGLDGLVVSSRRAELRRADAELPVRANIMVNPLRPEQVREALKTALQNKPGVATEIAALNILRWVDRSHHLQAALLTPFYFKIAEEVFNEQTTLTAPPSGQKAVENWLTEAFIEKKLAAQKGYEKRDVRRWLGWLAAKMNEREMVRFELADLQPWMLTRKWVFGFVFSLIFGFLSVLALCMITDVIPIIIGGLISSILPALRYILSGKFDLIAHLLQLKTPYQRILKSSTILLNETALSLVLFSLIIGFTIASEKRCHAFIFSFWFLFYGYAKENLIVLHPILRVCLTIEKTLPLRLVPFLNHAVRPLRFMDKEDGGTWRFRHQILQDFFEEKWRSGAWR